MALPKVNTIEYFAKLPVSGKEVKYRPFSVGEQKVLLQALEDENNRTITHTIINLVESCSEIENGKITSLSNADLEYLFLQIRIKSVGEKTRVVLGCKNQPQCDGTTDVGVTLRVPNYNEIQQSLGGDEVANIGISDIFKILTYSIDSIFDADEVHSRGDFTESELSEFMDGLSTEQFNKIMEWFSELPKMVKDVEYNCSKCSTECKVRLEGIQNFFV